MSNKQFTPTFSTNDIWRNEDTSRCLTDDLDNIDAEIDKLKHQGGDAYAPKSHTHTADDIVRGNVPVEHGGTGCDTAVDACNTMIRSLEQEDITFADNDVVICGDRVTYKQKPLIKVWDYIKAKADKQYAPVEHTHDDITMEDVGITIGTEDAPETGKPNTVYIQMTDNADFAVNGSSHRIMEYKKGWEAYSDWQRPTIYRIGKLRIMYGAVKNTEVKNLSGTNAELAFNIPAEDAPVRAVVSSNQHSGNTHHMVEIAGTNVSVGRCQDASSPIGKWWNLYTVWSVE